MTSVTGLFTWNPWPLAKAVFLLWTGRQFYVFFFFYFIISKEDELIESIHMGIWMSSCFQGYFCMIFMRKDQIFLSNLAFQFYFYIWFYFLWNTSSPFAFYLFIILLIDGL